MGTLTQHTFRARLAPRLTPRLLAVVAILIVSVFGSPTLTMAAPTAAGPVTGVSCSPSCDLYAATGTLTLSLPTGPVSVPIWSYTSDGSAPTALGGPVIVVNQGDAVTINLHNVNLPSSTSLAISQLRMLPDTVGVTAGSSKPYTVDTSAPGTYLYEAGLTADGPRQVAMGLFGALIVRPSSGCTPSTTCAYPVTASNDSTYADEALLVLSEIDPALNANPLTFEMSGYAPKYWLINSKTYPNTDPITTAAGNKVLLRYVNAGLKHHSMGLLGLRQTIVAIDGKPYTFTPYQVAAQTIPTGETLDTLTTIPATTGAKYALYDAAMHVDNNGARTGTAPTDPIAFGGMLTFVTVAGTPPGAAPVTNNVALSPNPTNGTVAVTLSASIGTSGDPSIDAAEYFVDATGTSGAGCAITTGLGAAPASVSAVIPVSGATAPCVDLTTLSSGNHTFYVHGHNSNGWGGFGSAVLNLDKTGPATNSLALNPNPTNGSVDVALDATGDDTATGNSNVDTAEYFIDTCPAVTTRGTAMTQNTPPLPATATQVHFVATIPAATVAALSEGPHAVNVRSHDKLPSPSAEPGNWGPCATITLNVDKTGPTTSGVSTTPNPTNGTIGVIVDDRLLHRIDATADDPVAGGIQSNLKGAEYFIDTVGANGTGGVFVANGGGGVFDNPHEVIYATIPLYGIAALPQGQHTISVHAQDVAGNWGTFATTALNIDKTGPNTTINSLTPNPTNGATSVSLVASATDPVNTAVPPATVSAPASVITGGEWFIGPDQGPGLGTLISVATPATTVNLNATVPLAGLTFNSYLFSVRGRDIASNWGPPATTLLNVLPADGIFADGFELANFSAWNGGVTGSGLTTPRAAAMGATVFTNGFGMQAAISGGASNYVQDNTPTAQTGYRVRFYFNPNNVASGTGQQHDIFVALNGSSQTVFRIQYRRNSASGNAPQVRAVSARTSGFATNATNWFNITNNAPNSIEVSWQSAASAPFRLYINGTLQQTLALNTSGAALRVETVRLGPQVGPAQANGPAPSGTTTLAGVSGTEYFDSFVSRSNSNSLIGP